MAKGFAIHNAPTDHGGFIPSTQVRSSQQGNLFVRAGDGHFCPKCKCWSTVIKSHDHVIFDDKAVAYVGDKLTCGARIQPQQTHVVGDSGSPYKSVSEVQNTNNFMHVSKDEYGQRFLLLDELTGEPLANICYEIEKSSEIIHGKTDENGYTEVISGDSAEDVKIHIIYEEHDHE
jgi:uncharacterized Zn-binding protein involved in type VI secretion